MLHSDADTRHRMPYSQRMSVLEPASAAWHSALAEKDAAAHDRMAVFTDQGEVELLRRRLEATAAELDVARAGVDVRNRILREQTAALVERDERIRALEAAREAEAAASVDARTRLGRGRSAIARTIAGWRP